MKNKRLIGFLLAFAMILGLVAGGSTNTAKADEIIYLKATEGTATSFVTGAGQNVARRDIIELSTASYEISYPEFRIKAKGNAPLTFSNIKVTDKDGSNTAWNLTKNVPVYISYNVKVDDNAKIGTYQYVIESTKSLLDANGNEIVVDPLEITVLVTSEKQGPQIVVVGQTDFNVNPGDYFPLSLSLKNVGDWAAYNTEVYVKYDNTVLTPDAAAIKQNAGIIEINETGKVVFDYKVLKNAKPGKYKFDVEITYKDIKSNEYTADVYYVNVTVIGPDPTPTPTPTPAIVEGNVRITEITQSVAEPKAGEEFSVSFYVNNTGKSAITDLKIIADLGASGFEPVTADPYIYIDKINPGKKEKVKINLKCGKNITEGFHTLGISYTYNDGVDKNASGSSSFYILNVKSADDTGVSKPKLMVGSFSTGVDKLLAAQTFTFTFDVKNTNETTKAKNIKIKVTSNSFSVVAGSNTFFVNEILPGQSETVQIDLKASAALTTGEYPINVSMEYEYEGMPSNITGVDASDELLVHVDESLRASVENVTAGDWNGITSGQSTTLTFELYNMGKSILNNTYATVEGDFQLANGSSYYIGNLQPGSPEYVECNIMPINEGDCAGTLVIHMEDSNGNEVTFEKEFTAYVNSAGGYIDPGFDPGWDPGMIDPGFEPEVEDENKIVAFFKNLQWWVYAIAGAVIVAAIVIPVVAVNVHKKNKEFEDFDD